MCAYKQPVPKATYCKYVGKSLKLCLEHTVRDARSNVGHGGGGRH